MNGLALALALGAAGAGLHPPSGTLSRLEPAPLQVFRIAWQRPVVSSITAAVNALEAGGAGVDPATGVVVVGTRDGWIHALREDGSVVWEILTGGAVTGTPLVDGDTVYVGGSDGKLRAIALATGKVRWIYEAREELGTLPSIADGTLYVATLQDTVIAVDARTGAWRWHHRRPPSTGSKFTIRGAARAVVKGGTVYAGYSDGHVAALDAATGVPRWDRLVAPPGDQLDVDSLAAEGGRVYAAAYSGAVLAIEGADGSVAWTFQAPGATRVAVNGGLVVAVTVNAVYGLSRDGGQALWTSPLEGVPGAAPPTFAGGWVLVPAGKGGLRVLEASTGRAVRVLDPGTGVDAAPGVLDRRVYVLSNGGELLALDLT